MRFRDFRNSIRSVNPKNKPNDYKTIAEDEDSQGLHQRDLDPYLFSDKKAYTEKYSCKDEWSECT